MEAIEYFSGAVRIDPLIFYINIGLIIHFFAAWYLSAKNTGWVIDPWYVMMFFTYFLSFLLQYPFASSINNFATVGGRIFQIQGKLNEAYMLSLVGYFSMFAGAYVFRLFGYQSWINLIFIKPVKNTIGVLYKNVVTNGVVTSVLFFIYVSGLAFILVVAIQAGKVNDPRGVFYVNESIRAFYNFITSVSRVLSILLIGRIFQFNKMADKIYFVLFILITLFIGARSYIIAPVIMFFSFFVYFRYHGYVKFKNIILFAVSVFALILTLTFFRAGSQSNFLFQVFYGNSFADLRDFAWVLSMWKGEYFYGNTYLAGLMSFIPSTLSEFRTTWAIGRVTAIMCHFDPKLHAGLRPGTFGEAYLNFGVSGIVMLGVLLGYFGKYLSEKVKYHSYSGNRIEAVATTLYGVLILNCVITSGFFIVYVTLLVLLFLYGLKLLLADANTRSVRLKHN